MTNILTASAKRDARRCLRRYKYRYEDGYRPIRSEEFIAFGILWHEILEEYFNSLKTTWGRFDPSTRSRLARDAGMARIVTYEMKAHGMALYKRNECLSIVAKIRPLFIGYHIRWCADDLTSEVVEAEKVFEDQHVNPDTGANSRTWVEAGVIDVVLRHAGALIVMEHKSTTDRVTQGSEYWRKLRMDTQVSQYISAVGADRCIYDVVSRPEERLRQATPVESRKYTKEGKIYANQRDTDESFAEYESRIAENIANNPDEYYQRADVFRTEADMLEFRSDSWALGRTIADARRLNRWPRNPDGCHQMGRLCEFFDVCSGQASITDPIQFVKIDDVHPELRRRTASDVESENAQ